MKATIIVLGSWLSISCLMASETTLVQVNKSFLQDAAMRKVNAAPGALDVSDWVLASVSYSSGPDLESGNIFVTLVPASAITNGIQEGLGFSVNASRVPGLRMKNALAGDTNVVITINAITLAQSDVHNGANPGTTGAPMVHMNKYRIQDVATRAVVAAHSRLKSTAFVLSSVSYSSGADLESGTVKATLLFPDAARRTVSIFGTNLIAHYHFDGYEVSLSNHGAVLGISKAEATKDKAL